MGDYRVFFYGTLMAPEVLYRVCYGTTQPEKWQTQSLTIRPAILHGYERHKVMDADYPGIVPAEPSPDSSYLASTVRGTLVTGLTEGDLWRLDIFEGVEYERQDVDVLPLDVVGDESGRGNVESTTPVRAQTYVFAESRDRLEPGEWDFGDFVRTKMVRWTGGNEEYEGKSSELRPSIREVDEAVKQVGERDPTNGRGMGGAITEQLRQEALGREILEGAV